MVPTRSLLTVSLSLSCRVALYGWEFGQEGVYGRAAPFIQPKCVRAEGKDREPPSQHGVACDYPGAYVPYGCNPTFRVCRYTPGGHFLPHQDGGHYVNTRNFSIKTIMVYLNNEFEGGATSFYTVRTRVCVRVCLPVLLKPKALASTVRSSGCVRGPCA